MEKSMPLPLRLFPPMAHCAMVFPLWHFALWLLPLRLFPICHFPLWQSRMWHLAMSLAPMTLLWLSPIEIFPMKKSIDKKLPKNPKYLQKSPYKKVLPTTHSDTIPLQETGNFASTHHATLNIS